ncbi:MAG: sugar phosphate isomerase/epimerase [Armatimonadota bacterium]|jgi:sugar phosphate isomerase/epimerase
MRLSCSTCSIPKHDLNAAVEAIRRTGYDYMEAFTTWTDCALGPGSVPAGEAQALLARHGVGLSSLNGHAVTAMSGGAIADCLPPILGDLRYAKEMELTRLNIRGAKQDQPMEVFVEGLRRVALEAARMAMGLIIGNHSGNRLERPEELSAAFEGAGADNVGMLVDAGHFYSVDVDPASAIRELGDHLQLLHIKDQIGRQSVRFGEGEMDVAGILKAARDVGYDGFVVVEMEVEDAENTEQYLAEGKEYLEDLLGRL